MKWKVTIYLMSGNKVELVMDYFNVTNHRDGSTSFDFKWDRSSNLPYLAYYDPNRIEAIVTETIEENE